MLAREGGRGTRLLLRVESAKKGEKMLGMGPIATGLEVKRGLDPLSRYKSRLSKPLGPTSLFS